MMKKNFITKKPEAETIQKNAASPKSLMSRRNMKFGVLLLAILLAVTGCNKNKDSNLPEATDEQIEQVYQEIKLSADSILISADPIAGFEAMATEYAKMEEVKAVEVREDGLFVKMGNDRVVIWYLPAEIQMESGQQAMSALLSKASTTASSTGTGKSVCLINQQSYESGRTWNTVCINILYERFYSCGWDVRIIENTDVNLAFIRDSLEKYDAVYYIAHGSEFDNKVWICTNETTLEEQSTSCALINLVDKDRGLVKENYAFNADFINKYYQCKIPTGSIVYMVSCQSMGSRGKANNTMAEAFVKHGATVYLGWNESNYSGQEAGMFLYDQLLSGKTLNEAYASLESFPANVRRAWQQYNLGFVFSGSDLENLAEDKLGWGEPEHKYTATLNFHPATAGNFRLVDPNAIPKITMTTTANTVGITLSGSGTANVNWGDGTSEMLAITGNSIEHTYASSGSRTITITGGNITMLNCAGNQLTALDVSKNTALTALYCGSNQLTALNVSKNTALSMLWCESNQLVALDVSKTLTRLNCPYNQLTALDLSKNTALSMLWCHNNQLNAGALNTLFGTLHGNTIPNQSKEINISGNPGESTCDKSIATNKGWIF
jgi:hypothetical protein